MEELSISDLRSKMESGELTSHAIVEEYLERIQRDLVESMSIEKVAQLVDQMTTGQVADVLSILSASEANEILKLLDRQNVVKIHAIMDHHEENILDYATQEKRRSLRRLWTRMSIRLTRTALSKRRTRNSPAMIIVPFRSPMMTMYYMDASPTARLLV